MGSLRLAECFFLLWLLEDKTGLSSDKGSLQQWNFSWCWHYPWPSEERSFLNVKNYFESQRKFTLDKFNQILLMAKDKKGSTTNVKCRISLSICLHGFLKHKIY